MASESGNERPVALSLGQIEINYALQESSLKAIAHQ